MPRNRLYIFLIPIILLTACVEPFEPDITESQELLVINGMVTDQEGMHRVTVSRSTPFGDPSFMAVQGCVVAVEDNLGNLEVYLESRPGIYEAYLSPPFLSEGKSYSLMIRTPEDKEYRSSYDSLLTCPPIDSLWFEQEKQGTANPEVNLHGIRFYTNLRGGPGMARNFRWTLSETWEYNAPFFSDYIWFGGPLIPNLSDSTYVCYMNGTVREIFVASTNRLSVNKLNRNALNYIPNTTPRLKIRYSLQVTQHSLTDEAYAYWDKLKSQSTEGGGLYETQPASTRGNIFNVNNDQEKVLGLFYATQQKTERIILKNTFDFDVPGFYCTLDTIQNLSELDDNYPHYLFSISPSGIGPPYTTGRNQCFDCRLLGGSNEKPEYWPK